MTKTVEFDDRRKVLEQLHRAHTAKRWGIAALGLQNFQAIAGPTFIPLAPLTLLYGPNSGGKSAVGDALKLVSSCAASNENDTFIQLLLRWTSFNAIANGRKLQPYVRHPAAVGLWVTIGPGDYFPWFYERNHQFVSMDALDTPAARLFGDGLFTVRWLMDIQDDYRVPKEGCSSSFAIWVGAESLEPLIEVQGNLPANDGERFAIVRINMAHPKSEEIDVLWQSERPGRQGLGKWLDGRPTAAVANWITVEGFDWSDFQPARFSILNSDEAFEEDEKELLQFCSSLIEGCLYLVSILGQAVVVPPIRSVPSRTESTFLFTGAGGKLAMDGSKVELGGGHAWNPRKLRSFLEADPWRELARVGAGLKSRQFKVGLFDYVNDLIQRESILGLGYRLRALSFEIGVSKAPRRGKALAAISAAAGHIVHLDLLDERGNAVEIEDVGTGVSQLIPVLVALFREWPVFVHQPELHLHPQLQSVLGDILLKRLSYRNVFTIVESHSEHLLLRVLRRMRESADGASVQSPHQIHGEDLVVLYFDKSDDGITDVKVLRVDGRGEFLDRWPHGFFSERDEDLDAFAI